MLLYMKRGSTATQRVNSPLDKHRDVCFFVRTIGRVVWRRIVLYQLHTCLRCLRLTISRCY